MNMPTIVAYSCIARQPVELVCVKLSTLVDGRHDVTLIQPAVAIFIYVGTIPGVHILHSRVERQTRACPVETNGSD